MAGQISALISDLTSIDAFSNLHPIMTIDWIVDDDVSSDRMSELTF